MRFKNLAKSEILYLTPDKLKLQKFENCIFQGEEITLGPGFAFMDEPIFHTDDSSPFDMSFFLTDCYITYKGEYGRIGINMAENVFGYIAYNMIFISETGRAGQLGSIEFSRSGEEFVAPEGFAVFSGKKTVGDGIYLLYLQPYSGESYVGIREYSSADDRWSVINDSDIYKPVVLEYGRGESYHFAEINGNPLRFKEPSTPEPKNMLGPGFISKFTTDGASFGFSLPYMKLDSSLISATLSLEGKSYEFKIYGDSITSQPQTIDGEEVVMYCDRGFGRVYFKKNSGGEWVPPFSSEYNNLKVTADKTVAGHRELVSSMTSAKKPAGTAVSSGEPITIFWGSRFAPSTLLLNSPADPLYFPVNSTYALGEEQEITDIISVSKNLFVFKGNEVYKSELKAVGERADYPLKFSLVTCLPSAPAKNTVARLKDSLFYADEQGNVYSLSLSGSYPYSKLCGGDGGYAFALGTEDKYLLIKGNTLLLLQQRGNDIVFGSWTLKDNCVGALWSPKATLFLFEKRGEGQYDIVAATLDNGGSSQGATVGFKVLPDMGGIRLSAITLFGEGGEFTLTLYSGDKKVQKRRGSLKRCRERLQLGAYSDSLWAELCFKEGFTIGKVKFDYTKGAEK